MTHDSDKVPISQLAEISPGRLRVQLSPEDQVSFIAMPDVNEAGLWVNRQVRCFQEVSAGFTSFVEGDVLFAKITPCMENGKGAHAIGLVNGVGFGSTEFYVLRAKPGVDSGFLFHWSQSPRLRTKAEAFMIGSAGQQRVQRAFFERYEVAQLPFAEQRRIAEILDTVDEAIRKTEEVIAKLQQMKQGLLHDLLTRGIDDNGELRDPDRHPEQFVESVQGPIPIGWQALTLGEVCKARQGLQIPIASRHDSPGPGRWMYITVQLLNSGFDPAIAEYVKPPTPRVVCRRADILVSRTGATGNIVTDVEGAFHNNFFAVDYDPLLIERDYLVTWLRSPRIYAAMLAAAGTTTIPDLNHGDFYAIPFCLPCAEEQVRIVEVARASVQRLEAERAELNKLVQLKVGLMDDLLTGRVRVNVTAAEEDAA